MQNRYKLSKYNAAFLSHDTYDNEAGYVSATSLLKPSREILINRLWSNEPYTDVSDLIAMQIGTGLHNLREQTPYDECIMREERMFSSLEHLGVTAFGLSGKPDLIDFDYNQPQVPSDSGLVVIEDLKVSSVFKLIYKDFEEYALQLSILKYLALRDQHLKKKLEKLDISQTADSFSDIGIITFLAKNWSKNNADLSPIPLKEIPLPLIDDASIEARIKRKCIELQQYWDVTDQNELPRCSNKIILKYGGKNCSDYCSARFNCNRSPAYIDDKNRKIHKKNG